MVGVPDHRDPPQPFADRGQAPALAAERILYEQTECDRSQLRGPRLRGRRVQTERPDGEERVLMPQVQRVPDEADRDDRAVRQHAPISPFLILSKLSL